VARDASAFMTAHVLIPSLDPQRPATLSPTVATELLRSKLGFDGVLITDCLEMNALSGFGAERAAVEALNAGADLLLFSHRVDLALAAASAVEAAVAQRRLPLRRLEEAHARVMRLRAASSEPLPVDGFAPHPNIAREIGRRAITLLRGVPEADPGASLAISFGGGVAALQREAPALDGLSLSLDPAPEEREQIFATLTRTQRRPILLTRRAHLHPAQAETVVTTLQRYPDGIVVSLLEPFDCALFTAARHLLAAYGDDVASIGGLADVLFGSSMPTGQLPVALPRAGKVKA
jgi:beta-N-acetylhexosaminidase